MVLKMGDLLRTTVELVVRKDGFAFDHSDCDVEGRVPRDWLDGADILPPGTLYSFVRLGDEDPEYALVKRDIVGRPIFIRVDLLELVAGIDDAIDDEENPDPWL